MLAFPLSYGALCLTQGLVVAAPASGRFPALTRLTSRWWAVAPLVSIVATVAAIRAAQGVADGLTWLALVTTPPLAALAVARVLRLGNARLAALCVPLLFALAWWQHGSLVGDVASTALTAGACISLAALLAAIAPAGWLKIGLLLMAAADTTLVVIQLLQAPNNVLNAAAPPGGLPQFQSAELGSAVMGYGDLFAAALLGVLLAHDRRLQLRGAVLTTVFAWCFGLLFFVVHTLPATVPVAAALVVTEWTGASAAASRRIVPRPLPEDFQT